MNDTVYVNVESVIPTSPGTTLLGVTLTVLPGSSPVSPLAMPWTWNVMGWTIFGTTTSGSGNWVRINGMQKHLPLPSGDDRTGVWSPTMTSVDAALQAAITQINRHDPNLPTVDPLKGITFSNNDQTTSAAHRYLSLLLDTAATPYPVPQNLNLSFFIELSPAVAFVEFVALPTFANAGVVYDPSTLPNPTTPAWNASLVGLDMHAEAANPDASGAIPASLWLPPVPGFGQDLLVSNWPTFIYDLIAPYLDVAHVLMSLEKDSFLPSPLQLATWREFRLWVIHCLWDLIHTGVSSPSVPIYDEVSWTTMLRIRLGKDFAQLPALNPESLIIAKSFDEELANLSRIATATVSGETLLYLVQEAYAGQPNFIPSSLLNADKAPQLARWLQLQLAVPLAKEISNACATTNPPGLDSVATAIINNVISPNFNTRSNNGTIPVWLSTVRTVCLAYVRRFFPSDLKQRALGTTDVATAPALTSTAAPMIIPVMQLRAGNDTTSQDPLRGIRGVGVLMRRASTPAMNWSCLNIVSPLLSNGPDMNCHLLVGSRLIYNQNLLTGFLSYDNGPLSCQNVLHEYQEQQNRLTSASVDGSSLSIDPVLQYAPYEGTDPGFFGTPALQVSKTYEVLCFAISNSGAVPKELRDGFPAKLRPLSARSTILGMKTSIIPYFRTVPVGGLEERYSDGTPLNKPNGFFPRIPGDVWPRAIETNVPSTGVGPTAQPTTKSSKPPLLLLGPKASCGLKLDAETSVFSFSLKLPSVEPLTWDRSVGVNLPDQSVRWRVLDQAYTLMKRNQKAGITDPLIQEVHFNLYQWVSAPRAGNWKAVPGGVVYKIDELRKHDLSAPSGVETNPVMVSVNGGTGISSAGVGGNDGGIQLSIPSKTPGQTLVQTLAKNLAEGEIFLIEATFTLTETTAILPRYPKTMVAYQLLFEIASASMPANISGPRIFTVTPAAINGIPDQRVEIRLAPDGSSAWKNITRADFLRQTWAWTGRTQPVIEFPPNVNHNLKPGTYPLGNPVAIQEWEKIEFAERPAIDHIEFTSVFNNGAFRLDQDVSLDLRATHVRFAPRVFSRYQGMFQGQDWYVGNTVGNDRTPDRWTSCFVRSRVRKLKMPRLKALIPFTESAFALGTPGVLAVFDGPAFDRAGLAERLRVSVATVHDPDLSIVKSWGQTGPDIEMSSEVVDPDPNKQVVPTLMAIGPIGHTFDPLLPFPKFVSHSYIIRPVNAIDPNDPDVGHDYSWWFADLQFQLTIDADKSVFGDPTIETEITRSSWIQFLPGFQDSQHHADKLANWSLNWDGIATIFVVDENKRAVSRNKSNELHVRHYLLISRTVVDVSGITREAYVGMAGYDGSGWKFLTTPSFKNPAQVRLRGRFLDTRAGEINSPTDSPPKSDAEFWTRIVGGKAAGINDDNRATPVSLSSVISQKGGSQ